MLRPGVGLALALAAAPAAARDVSIEGSVRLRYEAVGGQLREGFDRSDDAYNIRTTLKAQYVPGTVHLVGEIYDSRVYGTDSRSAVTNNEVNALELVQAFIGNDFKGVFGEESVLTLDAGRMLLNLGSTRLVASDDYRNDTSSYTGLRARFKAKGGWDGTLIYMLPQMRLPDDRAEIRRNKVQFDRESLDLVLWGGTIARAGTVGPLTAEVSYFHLGEDDAPGRPNRNRSLDTYGGRLIRKPEAGKWDVELEGYRQTGTIRASSQANAGTLPVRAWFLHANAGYTFKGGWTPRLAVDFDAASGDGPGKRFGRFDTLFGSRRGDLAPSGIFAEIGRANIVAAGPRIEIEPDKRWDAFLSYRPMWLESRSDAFSTSDVRDETGQSGRFAGHLIDTRARYWIVPRHLRAEVDGTLIVNGHFLRDAPNGSAQETVRYVSLNLTAAM